MWVPSLGRKIPLRRAWQPTPVFLPGESHEQRSLAGFSPYSCKKLDMNEVTAHTFNTILRKIHSTSITYIKFTF